MKLLAWHVLVRPLAAVIRRVVLWFGPRRLTLSLRGLTRAPRAVASGDHDARLPPGVAGEVGGLAASFQHMLEKLRAPRQTIEPWDSVLEQEVAKRTSELSAINAIARAVGESLDLRAILHGALATLQGVVPVDGASIYLLDETGDRLETHIHRGVFERFSQPADESPLVAEHIAGIARGGVPVVAEEMPPEAREALPLAEEGLRSIVALPLIAKGAALGSLVVASRTRRAFGHEEVDTLRSIAAVIAVAIENSRLYQASVRRGQQISAMARMAASISSSLNIADVYDAFAQEARSLVDYDRSSIILADEVAGLVRAVGVASAAPTQLPVGSVLSLKGNALETLMQTGKAHIEEDLEASSLFVEDQVLIADGLRSVIRLPLRAKGRVIGALNFSSRRRAAYGESDYALLQQLADHVAIAAENHRLYSQTDEQLRARIWELSHLVTISRIVSAANSLDEILGRAAEESTQIMGLSRCTISLFDEDSGQLRVSAIHDARGAADDYVGRFLAPEECPGLKAALEKRSTTLLCSEGDLAPAERDLVRHLELTCGMIVPLQAGGELMGSMFLASDSAGRSFTVNEVEVAEAVASQVAVAIQRAGLYQSVAAEKSQLEALLSSMSEGMFGTDNELRITAVNPWLARITGVPAEQMVGRRCDEVFHHEDEDGRRLCRAACPIASALASIGPVYRRHDVFRTGNGGQITVSMSTAPVVDVSGAVIGSVNVCRDVSSERELERVRAEIVQVISHELRTPLTSIQGFSELLLTRSFRQEQRQEFLTEINRESDRLGRLLGDVLDVSRIDSGRMVLHRQPVQLADAVKECVASLAVQLMDHRVAIEVEPGLPAVDVDPDRLAQILSNLVSNASKYSLSGTEIAIRGWAAQENPDGTFARVSAPDGDLVVAWVTLEVSDQGIGVPAEHMPRIFEAFHRIDNSLTRSVPGTGLGLAIVHRLVRMHGARVWVSSEEGRGSSFYVALPAVRGADGGEDWPGGSSAVGRLDEEAPTALA